MAGIVWVMSAQPGHTPAPQETSAPPTRRVRHTRPPGTTRLTADVPESDAHLLAETAQTTGFNRVTTLIRAIRVLAELIKAEDAGGKIQITYPDGTRERLLLR